MMSSPDSSRHTANRLAREKSPYLLQHAHNPVDWYPWGAEAFEKARREKKPILVSIGYSTCHWCHVMERESFEDPKTAALMNKYFVNIKVDREEMPDVDATYMTAVQAMTGGGGWPLNVFLTPDLKPFYGGTYFPPKAGYGRSSWIELLERIHQIWTEKPEELEKSADQLTNAIRGYAAIPAGNALLTPEVFQKCESHFAGSYDRVHGGFGGAPKFPRPAVFYFLTRRFAKTGKSETLAMTTHTLRQIARGGIYDQLGGGFARYSVDERWLVPHFEKMLYDNAQLVVALVEAHQLTGDDFFSGVARETLDYVKREMTHPDGGFYSAEDADSEGVEGKFYVWSKHEIDQILGPEKAAIFDDYFGVTEHGNFEDFPASAAGGHGANILHQTSSLPEIAQKHKKTAGQISEILGESAQKLFEVRARRVHPHLDDKILTSWNGLMISAFARASQALDDPALAQAGARAAKFIEAKLYDPKTRQLRHRWRDGESDRQSFQTDYAFLIQGLLDLYEATFDPHWLAWAIDLNETQTRLFYDSANGGFFMTPEDKEHQLVRLKDDTDNAEPSGNSVALLNLIRLSHLTGREELRAMAEKTFGLFAGRLIQGPFILPEMVAAYFYWLEKPAQIIIAGDRQSPQTRELLRVVNRRFIPFKTLIVVDEEARPALSKIQPFLGTLKPIGGKPAAYVCENFACKLPTFDAKKLDELLRPLSPKKASSSGGEP